MKRTFEMNCALRGTVRESEEYSSKVRFRNVIKTFEMFVRKVIKTFEMNCALRGTVRESEEYSLKVRFRNVIKNVRNVRSKSYKKRSKCFQQPFQLKRLNKRRLHYSGFRAVILSLKFHTR